MTEKLSVDKIRFLIVYGGKNEYAVSRESAYYIYSILKQSRLKLDPMFLSVKERCLLLHSHDESVSGQVSLIRGGLLYFGEKVKIDAAINIMHSSEIMDFGSQLSLLLPFGVSSIAPSAETTSITTDKIATRIFFAKYLDSVSIRRTQCRMVHHTDQIPLIEGGNVIVKSRVSGSSLNLYYCRTTHDIHRALKKLFVEDFPPFIVEDYLKHTREVSVFLMRTKDGIHSTVPIVTQILPKEKIRGYDEKYRSAEDKEMIRFLTDSEKKKHLKTLYEASRTMFQQLPGSSSMLRVDYMLTDDDAIYFNELESNPGFTEHSIAKFDSSFNAPSLLVDIVSDILPPE